MCPSANRLYAHLALQYEPPTRPERNTRLGKSDGSGYDAAQTERLRQIHKRLIEARRELDALIGDAYLRPRASIVPVHFLDLASAVEKLRWAEKEWRELDEKRGAQEQAAQQPEPEPVSAEAPGS